MGNTLTNILSKMLVINPLLRSTSNEIVTELLQSLISCHKCNTMEREKSISICSLCLQHRICIGCQRTTGLNCGCSD